jgi:hypothetical protein
MKPIFKPNNPPSWSSEHLFPLEIRMCAMMALMYQYGSKKSGMKED